MAHSIHRAPDHFIVNLVNLSSRQVKIQKGVEIGKLFIVNDKLINNPDNGNIRRVYIPEREANINLNSEVNPHIKDVINCVEIKTAKSEGVPWDPGIKKKILGDV